MNARQLKMVRQQLIVALMSASALFGCSQHEEPSPREPSIAPQEFSGLSTYPVVRQTVPQESNFDGTLEAVNQATISAQTSGRVTALPYDVGDLVPKGATVVQLTDTEQTAAVKAAEGQLRETQIRHEEAARNFKRAESVYAKKLISEADFDKAKTELSAATARLDGATASLKTAEQNLAYTNIIAPYSGILLQRHVQVGEAVSPGKPLLTGLSLEQMRISVDVPANQISALREHQSARVILPSGNSIPVESLRFPPSTQEATQSFRVLALLPKGDYTLYPGTLVKVVFVSGEAQQILIPQTAIVRRGEITAAYVLTADNRLNLRYLRLGQPGSNPELIPVLAGIAEGERVVQDPAAAANALRQRTAP